MDEVKAYVGLFYCLYDVYEFGNQHFVAYLVYELKVES